jgi:hypothetical protein
MPDSTTKSGGEKQISYLTFFVTVNYTKLKIILFSEQVQKKINSADTESKYLTKKYKVSEPLVWIWDPRFRIRKTHPVPGTGSRGKKAPEPVSGSSTLMFSKKEATKDQKDLKDRPRSTILNEARLLFIGTYTSSEELAWRLLLHLNVYQYSCIIFILSLKAWVRIRILQKSRI